MKDKLNKFSVPLGLLDYGNPIFYAITMYFLLTNMYKVIESPYNTIMLIGAIISIIFGLIIPTGKVLVGLGIIKFKMPVSLVFCVNTGIFITGLMLLKHVFDINLLLLIIIALISILLLVFIYMQSKKFNTIAVLIGAIGYLMLYISLITLSINMDIALPILFYGLAILFFFMLCGIGIKADLKNPKVHWLIESCNVLCQMFVAIGTIILFH